MTRDEPYLDDPLLRELIPIRPTRVPPAVDGPSARWMRALEDDNQKSRSVSDLHGPLPHTNDKKAV